MPVTDICQPEVETALRKDGWTIVGTQVNIKKGKFLIYVDLEAAKEENTTLIEVKCFNRKEQDEFYTSIGQYIAYRNVIRTQRPQHTLYLAVPEAVYDAFTDVHHEILVENYVKLIIVNLELEVITKWIE